MWHYFRTLRELVRLRRRVRELEEALEPFASMLTDHGSLFNSCKRARFILKEGKWR